jgi:hypothetical protein
MTKTRFAMMWLLAVTVFLGFTPVARGQASGPDVSPAVQFDTSPPLAVLATMVVPGDGSGNPGGLLAELPEPQGDVTDPVLQSNQNILGDVRAPIGLNFAGLSINAAGGGNVTPPDTEGVVGATQYVQWINLAFAIYDKTTGVKIAGPFLGNTLWAGFGGDCQNLNSGDPVVAYDKIANRWVFTQFAINSGASQGSECVAISTTSDATGPYFRYQFSYGQFVDYPKIGVWPDAYYATYNVFSFATGNPYLGPKLCALDRPSMLVGAPATQVCFQLTTSDFSILPADMDGTVLPPAGTPELLMSQDSNFSPSTILNLFRFHVDFVTATNSTLSRQAVTVAPYSDPCLSATRGACIPQPGTANPLESLTVHLMHRLVWRMAGGREELLANHTIVAGSSTGIRWYEIRTPSTTPVVFQQGTFAPDSSFRWMGSIAMDKMGNILLGYSVSDATATFPSIRFTGRLRTELRNLMETEASIKVGTGSATGARRWGDYSAMTVDPTDDCTFFYTNEYIPVTNAGFWATQIASAKFPNCH